MNDLPECTNEFYRFLRRRMEYVLTLLVEDPASPRALELLSAVPEEQRSIACRLLIDEAFLSGVRIRSLYVHGERWL